MLFCYDINQEEVKTYFTQKNVKNDCFATVVQGDQRVKKLTASSQIFATLTFEGKVFAHVIGRTKEEIESMHARNRPWSKEKIDEFFKRVATWRDVIDIGADNIFLYAITKDGKVLTAGIHGDYNSLDAGLTQVRNAFRLVEVKTNFAQNICIVDRNGQPIKLHRSDFILNRDFSQIQNLSITGMQAMVSYYNGVSTLSFGRARSAIDEKYRIENYIRYEDFHASDLIKLVDTSNYDEKAFLVLYNFGRMFYFVSPATSQEYIKKIAEVLEWRNVLDFCYDFEKEFVIARTDQDNLLCTANCLWKREVEQWRDVQSVIINQDSVTRFGETTTKIAVITTDGRVLSLGNAQQSKLIDTWRDITQVVFYDGHVYGLTNGGTVYKV